MIQLQYPIAGKEPLLLVLSAGNVLLNIRLTVDDAERLLSQLQGWKEKLQTAQEADSSPE